jgi:hypothetical protein
VDVNARDQGLATPRKKTQQHPKRESVSRKLIRELLIKEVEMMHFKVHVTTESGAFAYDAIGTLATVQDAAYDRYGVCGVSIIRVA